MLRIELHLPMARSLKDKRSVMKSVKEQLRGKFNVAASEIEPTEKWQRAILGVVTVSDERRSVEDSLAHVANWLREHPMAHVSVIEQDIY